MKKRKETGLDFEVDKLTNSIENVITGDNFKTEVSVLSAEDIKVVTNKKFWSFDWLFECEQHKRSVYKLTIVSNETIIQGLISVEIMEDHVYVHLIESASFNKGKTKVYLGVAGNLFAFACQLSFERGYDGYVVFTAKTKLIKHYEETLGAIRIGGHRMIINTVTARKLTNKYFP